MRFGQMLFVLFLFAAAAAPAAAQEIARVGQDIHVAAGAVVAGYWVASLLGPVAWILALVISLLVAGALIAGYTGLSSWLGGAVARRAGPLARVFLGGLLIILMQAVTLFVAMPVFLLLGFGAAVHSGFGSATDWLGRQFGARAGHPL
jgi:hypothetical protein